MSGANPTEGLVRPTASSGSRRPWEYQRSSLLVPLGALALLACAITLSADSEGEGPVSDAMAKGELDHMFREKAFLQDYPNWSKSIDQINSAGAGNHGVWKYYKGPPFLQRVTMYSGTDVDLSRGGNLVRRVLGLPLSFGQWEGNSYLHSFDSQQMRFLQSNEHSALVIPPLSEGDMPLLTDSGKHMLKQYTAVGHNTLILCGGPASVQFLNMNVLDKVGGDQLAPAWTRGPYEKQDSAVGTPFQTLPVTLPNVMNHAHGVRKISLPHEAISYFETDGVSVVFSLPYAQGQIMFVGFDFSSLDRPWVKTLIAAAQFAE